MDSTGRGLVTSLAMDQSVPDLVCLAIEKIEKIRVLFWIVGDQGQNSRFSLF
jgi:hypothetical protein